MQFSSRFNIRAKTRVEAVSLAGVFICGSIECDEVQKYTMDKEAKYPAYFAVEGMSCRVLGGKPSGPCLEAAFVCSEFAAHFFRKWTEEMGNHIQTLRRETWTLGIITAVMVGMLVWNLYDIIRNIP